VNDTTLRRPGPLALLLALVVAVLAAGVVGLSVRGGKAIYVSTSLVTIDEPQAVAAAKDDAILAKLSRLRFKYIGLVGTDRLAVPVADRLKVPVTQVRGRLSATLVPTDLLLRLSCRGPVLATTKACATALGASLVDYVVKEQSNTAIPPSERVVMTPIEQPPYTAVIGANRSRTIGLSLLAGVLGALLVLGIAARPRRP
jgi:hypothetical protein